MAKRSALGKGLGAFFGDDVVRSVGGNSADSHREGEENLKPSLKEAEDGENNVGEVRENGESFGKEQNSEKRTSNVSRETF